MSPSSTGKVRIVSEVYYPEETGTGYFLTRIAEGLSPHFPVHVLCGQPTYTSRGVRAPAREVHRGVTIRRCRATTFDVNVFFLKLMNLVTISLSIFFHSLLMFRRHDVVLVATNPPVLPFFIAIACKMRGAKCVLLLQDVYPETLVAAGMFPKEALPVRILNWLTKVLYEEMETICVLGRDMDALVRKKLGGKVSPGKITTIRNWADVDQITPDSSVRDTFLGELGLKDRFVLQYAGNMGNVHGIECLLEAAIRMSMIDESVHFLFIGFGAKKKWLEEAVKANGLGNVTILPNRPRSEQQAFLNACDIAISAFVPGMSGVGVPSRMYNIFAAGKPVIGAVEDDSEFALVVREENVGWIVPPNQPGIMVDVIRKARADRPRLDEMGRRARMVVERKYTFQHVIRSYRELLEGLFVKAN